MKQSIADIAFEPDTAEVVYWLSDETNNAILQQASRLGINPKELLREAFEKTCRNVTEGLVQSY
jgi:hypothetical protein